MAEKGAREGILDKEKARSGTTETGVTEEERADIEAELEATRREIAEAYAHLDSPDKKMPVVLDNGKFRTAKEIKPIKAITAAELDKMDIPPITWLVKDILPVGLSMIGAPSKYYKSYMALGYALLYARVANSWGLTARNTLVFTLTWKVRRGAQRTG